MDEQYDKLRALLQSWSKYINLYNKSRVKVLNRITTKIWLSNLYGYTKCLSVKDNLEINKQNILLYTNYSFIVNNRLGSGLLGTSIKNK